MIVYQALVSATVIFRDGRREVFPPTVLADGAKALESGEGAPPAMTNKMKTPARVYAYSEQHSGEP